MGLNVALTDRLSVFSGRKRNIEKGKNVEFNLGMFYKAQCWSLDVRYEDDGDDHDNRKLFFVVTFIWQTFQFLFLVCSPRNTDRHLAKFRISHRMALGTGSARFALGNPLLKRHITS